MVSGQREHSESAATTLDGRSVLEVATERVQQLVQRREVERKRLHTQWREQDATVKRNARKNASSKLRHRMSQQVHAAELMCAKIALASEVDEECALREAELRRTHLEGELDRLQLLDKVGMQMKPLHSTCECST